MGGWQDEYGGWLNARIVEDFAAYAAVCFKAFGNRVTYWTTFNEPLSFVFMGYETGVHAPGETRKPVPPLISVMARRASRSGKFLLDIPQAGTQSAIHSPEVSLCIEHSHRSGHSSSLEC